MSNKSNKPNKPNKPVSVLIAALGGEGGGVLTDWLIHAATAAGLPVQSTSIPGVAQRTGATTYYLEIFPTPRAELKGREPIMALYPGPGNIDLMVASELLELGRALENGYVAPDRTTLIGSTHRIYAIAEKSAMGDQRYQTDTILAAARELAQRAVLGDLAALAVQHDTVLNAVLLGVIAGTQVLPLAEQTLREAVRASGIAVESNLRGFEAGLQFARQLPSATHAAPAALKPVEVAAPLAAWPAPVQTVIATGIERLTDYQDPRYAEQYLDRLRPILHADHASGRGDFKLTYECARYLALWMSYEDVIRVADLKTRAERFQRVRADVRAKADEPVRITEFVKPGIPEIADLLPPRLGRALLRWGQRRGKPLNISMRVRSDTILGFLRLWLVARLQPWRRRSLRFQDEQQLIERWLNAVKNAAGYDYALALEIIECANLNKGYSETFARGRANFLSIFEHVIDPALADNTLPDPAAQVRAARQAALADPEGRELKHVLPQAPAQPIKWYPVKPG